MKTPFATLCQMMALTLLASCCFSALALAQDTETVVPRFVVLPPKPAPLGQQTQSTLQTWSGSFTYNGTNYPFTMVGADPSTNQGVVITTFLIPVKIILSTGESFDPVGSGPSSPMSRTITSPIFDGTTTYTQGGVNVGTTQYIDAFQRANFWSIVQNNPNSHLILGGPRAILTQLPELVLNVPSQFGHLGMPFHGHQAAEVDLNYFDAQISTYMTQHSQIQPNGFPIFVTTDTYLTQGGCCVGGYHSANGAQSYAHFTYIDHPGDFSQDVSALSHEVGEWADDPLVNGFNHTPCGVLEIGDPLETHTNYGSTSYQLHGFTYNLQDMTFLRYFGADANTSVNSWWTFQNYPYTRICQEGS